MLNEAFRPPATKTRKFEDGAKKENTVVKRHTLAVETH